MAAQAAEAQVPVIRSFKGTACSANGTAASFCCFQPLTTRMAIMLQRRMRKREEASYSD